MNALRDMWEEFNLIEFAIIAAIVGVFLAILVPGISGLHRNSVVTVDGKQVFSGRTYCVEVKSAGAATEIDIGRGPLCLLPGDHYVSKNVSVETH